MHKQTCIYQSNQPIQTRIQEKKNCTMYAYILPLSDKGCNFRNRGVSGKECNFRPEVGLQATSCVGPTGIKNLLRTAELETVRE